MRLDVANGGRPNTFRPEKKNKNQKHSQQQESHPVVHSCNISSRILGRAYQQPFASSVPSGSGAVNRFTAIRPLLTLHCSTFSGAASATSLPPCKAAPKERPRKRIVDHKTLRPTRSYSFDIELMFLLLYRSAVRRQDRLRRNDNLGVPAARLRIRVGCGPVGIVVVKDELAEHIASAVLEVDRKVCQVDELLQWLTFVGSPDLDGVAPTAGECSRRIPFVDHHFHLKGHPLVGHELKAVRQCVRAWRSIRAVVVALFQLIGRG